MSDSLLSIELLIASVGYATFGCYIRRRAHRHRSAVQEKYEPGFEMGQVFKLALPDY